MSVSQCAELYRRRRRELSASFCRQGPILCCCRLVSTGDETVLDRVASSCEMDSDCLHFGDPQGVGRCDKFLNDFSEAAPGPSGLTQAALLDQVLATARRINALWTE
jgi:hypothetical protein